MDWRAWSDEERERQVSPSSMIGGDYGPFIERYFADSESSVAALEPLGVVTLDFARDDSGYPVDVFLPPAPGGPILVYIHGGYWQELSRTFSRFAAKALHERGWGCVVVGYPLAPQATIDTMIEVCAGALRWTRTMLQPGALVVCGSSAGAHLAACAATEPDVSVDGLVLFSGVFDLEPLVGTSVNATLALCPDEAATLSPMNRAPNPAPTFVSWGENETPWFASMSTTYAYYLRTHGVAVTTHEAFRRNHFNIVHDLQDPRSAVTQWLNQLRD